MSRNTKRGSLADTQRASDLRRNTIQVCCWEVHLTLALNFSVMTKKNPNNKKKLVRVLNIYSNNWLIT